MHDAAYSYRADAHIFRSLMTPTFLISRNAWIIKEFTNLKNLHIDCSHCSLASQFSTFSKVFDALAADDNIVPNIASLTMTNLSRLDDCLLNLIAHALPQLTDLHVSTVEGLETECCPNCYDESLTRVMHSPIHGIYLDSELLAVSPIYSQWEEVDLEAVDELRESTQRFLKAEKALPWNFPLSV